MSTPKGDLLLYYPLWVVVDPESLRKDGLSMAAKFGISTEYGILLSLFTDEHLATEFASTIEKSKPYKIDHPQILWQVLEFYKEAGATHVGIDCPPNHNPLGKRGWTPTIQQFLDSFKM